MKNTPMQTDWNNRRRGKPTVKYESPDKLKPREIEFLQHLCRDLTNKEIALLMFVSVRTAEKYSDILSERLNCRSRVGLVIYAIKYGIFEIDLAV